MSKNVYVLVGGGSGGHIMPLIPISEAIKKLDSNAYIVHVGQKNDKFNDVLKSREELIDANYTISAGKYRRYNGESNLKRIFDFKTNFLNVRDLFRFIFGIFQARKLLKKVNPKIVFMKGGFVCAPVGIAASKLNISYITHDSDAIVSLAHRIIAGSASLHLTAMPVENYPKYDQAKTVQVGVPVRKEFSKVTSINKENLRKELGFSGEEKIILVVGGGLGSKVVNDSVIEGASQLLTDPMVRIVNVTGHKLYKSVCEKYKQLLDSELLKRVNIIDFTEEMYKFSGSADVVITRAGATNMAELSAQAKACIIVPNPLLTAGHQLKNAEVFANNKAAIVVNENNIQELIPKTIELLNNVNMQEELATKLNSMFINNAAEKIAKYLVNYSEFGGQNGNLQS
ncbi:MAG: glycosyltransferase [Candidatus Saccharibacteria bacterium]|nr:glycosyltransferase [Candidatus Saccharibacteria bacterium]